MRHWTLLAILATCSVLVTGARSVRAMPASPLFVAIVPVEVGDAPETDHKPALNQAAEEFEAAAVGPELAPAAVAESSCRLPIEGRRYKAISCTASNLFGHSLQLQHIRLQV